MKYQLTVRVPFEAIDNLAARQETLELLKTMNLPTQAVLKLQMLEANKPPVGVEFTAPVSGILSPTTVESTGV